MASACDQSQPPSISRSSLHRRPINSSNERPAAGGPLVPDVDPPPKPPAILQVLAFGFIVFLTCLQFLPATHFRDPNDRLRNWIPFDRNGMVNQNNPVPKNGEFEKIHVVSWTDCLDLRTLAVLVNSTLSSSRFPEHIYFHFFVPEGEDEKLSYYKLKVLLPHSNLTIIGQKEVKEKLRTAIPGWDLLGPSLHELVPLLIPIINPSLSRYIYISSAIMMKGNIEELSGIDMGMYALAAARTAVRDWVIM